MTLKFSYHTSADLDHKSFQEQFLLSMQSEFIHVIEREDIGFFQICERTNYLESTEAIYQSIKDKKHFVQIGIGGSALGPQMLVKALGKPIDKTFSVLDNIDADFIAEELEKIDPRQSVFYIVSKSGGTAETMACYAIVKNLLIDLGVTKEELKNYFVFCTDETNGDLRQHVNENKYLSLIVPQDIGGRFSVLSHVGLLPAIFMGVDIHKLYTGVNEFRSTLLSKNTFNNPLLQTAAHLAYLYTEPKIKVDQTVMMPYSSKLKDFSAWFVQLWAESLGKFSIEKNQNIGLTPIPAYGATDQHSQMQLFMEGPINKLLFLINIKERTNNFALNAGLELASSKKLSPFTVNDLMEAEFEGTLMALREAKRNYIHIEVDKLNEASLGALILFFESLTAIMGKYLLIEPFNQPGVELGKKYAYKYLSSLGK